MYISVVTLEATEVKSTKTVTITEAKKERKYFAAFNNSQLKVKNMLKIFKFSKDILKIC